MFLSKKELVLRLLNKGGWLTVSYADMKIGVTDLSKQVYMLKKDGHKIIRQFDPVTRTSMYHLVKTRKRKPTTSTQTDFAPVHVVKSNSVKKQSNASKVLSSLRQGVVLSAANCKSVLGMDAKTFKITVNSLQKTKNHSIISRPLTGATDKRCKEYLIDSSAAPKLSRTRTRSVTPQALAILSVIKKSPPIDVDTISNELNIPRSSVRTGLTVLSKHYPVSKKRDFGSNTKYYIAA